MADARLRKTCNACYLIVPLTGTGVKIHFVGFSHEYDEWRDYHNKRNYFPFGRLEKMFFPEEGSLEDRGNIHGQCIVA